jgi:hypothetical protein
MKHPKRTIKYLQRFAARRRRFDFYSNDSDIERLRRYEKALYTLLISTFSGLLALIKIAFDEPNSTGWIIFAIFLFGYFSYLAFEFARVQKAIDLFIKNGIQSVEELLGIIPQAEQGGGGNSAALRASP